MSGNGINEEVQRGQPGGGHQFPMSRLPGPGAAESRLRASLGTS